MYLVNVFAVIGDEGEKQRWRNKKKSKWISKLISRNGKNYEQRNEKKPMKPNAMISKASGH